ncbi:apyrase-like [Phlebotomus argentipes]|uniref:apyrase-like n=1 Tax=Phlebotomus argentipes TaxID=94469 RepID=UPI002892A7FC|nr:apyrase-like [Phlebotomus argentipes]
MAFVKYLCVILILTLSSALPNPRQEYDDEYRFEIIGDFDQKAISPVQPNTYFSDIHIGTVKVLNDSLLDIKFTGDVFDLVTKYAHNGRGSELSELLFFNGKMYTFEDKTGIIFDVTDNRLVPWVILGDGFGNETNGFKCEWATVKDDHIYVGSNARENFLNTGEIENRNNFYVKKVNKDGKVIHENWFEHYDKIRNSLEMPFPGFIVHEACVWSPINNQWIFLPRKCTPQSIFNVTEDYIGCNKIIFASEDFSTITHVDIQANPQPPERGFSSFKFLPDSDETIIVGLTTVETPEAVTTSIIAIDLEGRVLFPETKIIDDKYEGLAFFKHVISQGNLLEIVSWKIILLTVFLLLR